MRNWAWTASRDMCESSSLLATRIICKLGTCKAILLVEALAEPRALLHPTCPHIDERKALEFRTCASFAFKADIDCAHVHATNKTFLRGTEQPGVWQGLSRQPALVSKPALNSPPTREAPCRSFRCSPFPHRLTSSTTARRALLQFGCQVCPRLLLLSFFTSSGFTLPSVPA